MFKYIFDGLIVRFDPFQIPPLFRIPKITGEIYVKIVLLRKSEESETLYAITEDKKIIQLDFLQYSEFYGGYDPFDPPLEPFTPTSGPSGFSIKSFSAEEVIREAEYIDRTTFFLGCSETGRCAVVNFEI